MVGCVLRAVCCSMVNACWLWFVDHWSSVVVCSLLFVAWYLLFVVLPCCLLVVGCWMICFGCWLPVVCCGCLSIVHSGSMFFARCVLRVACCLLIVVCFAVFSVCFLLCVVRLCLIVDS